MQRVVCGCVCAIVCCLQKSQGLDGVDELMLLCLFGCVSGWLALCVFACALLCSVVLLNLVTREKDCEGAFECVCLSASYR